MTKKNDSKKIERFIQENLWDFSDFNTQELKEFLEKIDDISDIISKINRYEGNMKYYLLNTISNYEKFGFNENIVSLILNNKFDFLKDRPLKECPNLDCLYYAVEPNENLYKSIVADVKHGYQLKEYSRVISKNCTRLHNVFTKMSSTVTLKKQLLFLTPEKLDTLLSKSDFSNLKVEEKSRIYTDLVTYCSSLKKDINSLDDSQFIKFLNLICISSDEEIDMQTKSDLLKQMINSTDNVNLKDIISSYDNEVLSTAFRIYKSAQSPNLFDIFPKFLSDDFFKKSSVERQKVLLKLFEIKTAKYGINESMELVILDHDAINNELNEVNNMEFVNPKTNIHIMIKSKKN